MENEKMISAEKKRLVARIQVLEDVIKLSDFDYYQTLESHMDKLIARKLESYEQSTSPEKLYEQYSYAKE